MTKYPTEKQFQTLITMVERSKKLENMDNKKLLWIAKKLGICDEIEVFSPLDDVWAEIENRLYPEYDGIEITWEEWGWKTPDGEIRYFKK